MIVPVRFCVPLRAEKVAIEEALSCIPGAIGRPVLTNYS